MAEGSSYEIRPYNTRVQLLEPVDPIDANTRIMFYLPVEEQGSEVFGNPITITSNRSDYLNGTLNWVWAYPEFANVSKGSKDGPWYVNEEKKVLIEQLVPYVRGLYPQITNEAVGVAFSKSGWGLLSMMIDNPTLFVRAILFDAPLTITSPFAGSDYIFRGPFSQYDLNTRILNASWPQANNVYLAQYTTNFFETDMKDMSALMTTNNIPHIFDDAASQNHGWSGNWFNNIYSTYTTDLFP